MKMQVWLKVINLILMSICISLLIGSYIIPISAIGTSECPPMGQSLPCYIKETEKSKYPKCTNVPGGCCQYYCDYVKACDNNFYEICNEGVLLSGKQCDSASGKCY